STPIAPRPALRGTGSQRSALRCVGPLDLLRPRSPSRASPPCPPFLLAMLGGREGAEPPYPPSEARRSQLPIVPVGRSVASPTPPRTWCSYMSPRVRERRRKKKRCPTFQRFERCSPAPE